MSRVFEVSGYSQDNLFVGNGPLRNIIYSIRHSESHTNKGIKDPVTGQDIQSAKFVTTEAIDKDPNLRTGLTEGGVRIAEEQALKLRAELENVLREQNLSLNDIVIYSSPFNRALETAQIFTRVLSIDPENIVLERELRERNCGEFNGQDFHFPTVKAEIIDRDQDPHNDHRGVESPMEMLARTTRFIRSVDLIHRRKIILAFTHYNPMQELISAQRGDMPGTDQKVGYAAYHRLTLTKEIAYKPQTTMMLGSTPGYVNDATVQTSESVQCAQTSLAKRSDGIDFTVHPGKVVYTRQYCPEGGESVAVIASHAEPSAVRQVAQYLREEQKQSSLSVATYNGGQDAKHCTRGYTTFVPKITLDALASAWQVNAEIMKEGDLYATCGFYTRPGFNGVFVQSECNPDKPHHNSPEQVLAWEEMATRVAQKTARDLGVEINLEYHNVNFTYLYNKEIKAAPVNVMSRPSLFAHHKAVDRVPTINDLPAGYSFDI